MLEFPAGFLVSSFKGGRLAVAVAAGAAVPGGSGDDRPLYREVTRTGDRALFSSCSRARCILLVCVPM
jgi:hypothetical protein